jgi:hypothetical protein
MQPRIASRRDEGKKILVGIAGIARNVREIAGAEKVRLPSTAGGGNEVADLNVRGSAVPHAALRVEGEFLDHVPGVRERKLGDLASPGTAIGVSVVFRRLFLRWVRQRRN